MMYLETNISTIGIPVNVYHGQLNVSYSYLSDALFGRQTQFSSNSKHINCFRDSAADYDVCLDESDHAHVEEEIVANLGTFGQNSSRFTTEANDHNPIAILINDIISHSENMDLAYIGSYDTVSIATASGGADSDLTSKGSILGSSKGYRLVAIQMTKCYLADLNILGVMMME